MIDGGVVANNPTACGIVEAVRANAEKSSGVDLESFVVASFGTGRATRAISISEAQEWGALEWAIPIIDVLPDGASDAVHYVSRHLIPEERYFRFRTRLDKAYDNLDDASETNINALVNVAERRELLDSPRALSVSELVAAISLHPAQHIADN